jgi:hypothetical protein
MVLVLVLVLLVLLLLLLLLLRGRGRGRGKREDCSGGGGGGGDAIVGSPAPGGVLRSQQHGVMLLLAGPRGAHGVAVQVAFERHILKPGLMFKGTGLKSVSFKLWVKRVQRAPPHHGRRSRSRSGSGRRNDLVVREVRVRVAAVQVDPFESKF